jgi:hypothetical protein
MPSSSDTMPLTSVQTQPVNGLSLKAKAISKKPSMTK